MLPMFLVYLPVLCAGIQLPEIMRSVSLYLCFGSTALLPGLPTMLCMLEIISRSGRVVILVYAVWLYMPWSKRMFVLFSKRRWKRQDFETILHFRIQVRDFQNMFFKHF